MLYRPKNDVQFLYVILNSLSKCVDSAILMEDLLIAGVTQVMEN